MLGKAREKDAGFDHQTPRDAGGILGSLQSAAGKVSPSLMRNRSPLGLYSRPTPRAL